MGEDNLGLSTLAQGAKKNYEFLVKRDTQDNFGQSLITCFIFIAHSIYLQAYNAKYKRRFPKIQHIFSSTFPSENIPCNFQDDVEIVNGQKITLRKKHVHYTVIFDIPLPPQKRH